MNNQLYVPNALRVSDIQNHVRVWQGGINNHIEGMVLSDSERISQRAPPFCPYLLGMAESSKPGNEGGLIDMP